MKIPAALFTLAALLAAPAQASTVIEFDGLPGSNGDAFTSYSEDGYDVVATGGSVFVGKNFGNPAPSLVVGPVFDGGSSASIEVLLSNGGLFILNGFDIIGSNGNANFFVQGFRAGSSVFSFSGSQGFSFGTIGGMSGAIDRLSFDLTANGTSLNFDNVNLSAAAVPEPGTWMLMILGLGAVGFAMRRRQKAAVRFQFA